MHEGADRGAVDVLGDGDQLCPGFLQRVGDRRRRRSGCGPDDQPCGRSPSPDRALPQDGRAASSVRAGPQSWPTRPGRRTRRRPRHPARRPSTGKPPAGRGSSSPPARGPWSPARPSIPADRSPLASSPTCSLRCPRLSSRLVTSPRIRTAGIGCQRQQRGHEAVQVGLLAVDGHDPRRARPAARTSRLLAALASTRHGHLLRPRRTKRRELLPARFGRRSAA